MRGKPETFNRPDYNFRLVGNDGARAHRATSRCRSAIRQRGAPLDLIVAEAMILANSTWGGWLAELGVPGIYRSQASLAPGVKVRMGTKAAPHAGIGVKSYAWSTSPLRRYTDLVNQWQIIACGATRQDRRAGRAVQAQGRGAVLHHLGLRRRLLRLQRLPGRHGALLDAEVPAPAGHHRDHRRRCSSEGLVRADDMPLVLPVLGGNELPRGARVRVKLGEIDEITLDVQGHRGRTARYRAGRGMRRKRTTVTRNPWRARLPSRSMSTKLRHRPGR